MSAGGTAAPEVRRRSTADLLSDLAQSAGDLVRAELALFRAECSRNLSRGGAALGLVLAGVVIAIAALNVLTAAVVAAVVSTGVEPGWAAVLVAIPLTIIALALVVRGVRGLKMANFAPERTTRSIGRDYETVKEALR